MKSLIILIAFFVSSSVFSQLSGDIVVDKRQVVSNISYTMDMNVQGIIVFDISVNTDGKVTACDLNKVESTINSMRYSYDAKNRILTGLRFERGNGYPTFHRGKVTISSMPVE